MNLTSVFRLLKERKSWLVVYEKFITASFPTPTRVITAMELSGIIFTGEFVTAACEINFLGRTLKRLCSDKSDDWIQGIEPSQKSGLDVDGVPPPYVFAAKSLIFRCSQAFANLNAFLLFAERLTEKFGRFEGVQISLRLVGCRFHCVFLRSR